MMNQNTNSSSTDISGYLFLTPYRINPSLVDTREFIFDNKRQENHKFRKRHIVSDNGSDECNISLSLHTFLKENIRQLDETFICLNDFKRDSDNRIIDNRYKCSNYEQSLIKMLTKSKNEDEALSVLTQMWNDMKFCDLIFIVSNKQYLAHRLVLALNSAKYRTFFQIHRYDFVTRIVLNQSTPKPLQQVLNFLYTNQIVITIKTIDSILTCAQELGIKRLEKICDAAFSKFDKKYVFQILQITHKHLLEDSYYKVLLYLWCNFDQCIQLNSFLDVSYIILLDILSQNMTEKRDETLLLQRVLKYIVHNRIKLESESTYPHNIENLLKKIRFGMINVKEFNFLFHDKKYFFILQSFYTVISDVLKTSKRLPDAFDCLKIKNRSFSTDVSNIKTLNIKPKMSN